MVYNQTIIKEFKKLINQIKYEIDSNPKIIANYYRLRQIKNAFKIIQNYPKKIKKGEELEHIKGIGKGTIKRINEILQTGKLSEIKKQNDIAKHVAKLTQIFGIGKITAHEFVTQYNIKSISQLKKAHKNKIIELNDQILMGIKYHGIYKQNIPRSEINKIDSYIHKILHKLDNEAHAIICGSYRRLKMTSGDIDVLLTHPKVKTKTDLTKYNLLIKYVDALTKDGFIVDDLTHENYKEKYMGFCKLPKHSVRRIDIRYVPNESYYTALLYFTGSGEFNMKMRNLAKGLGYKLNEYGLYKKGKRIEVKSEKDIFDELGMEYISPDKR